MTLPATQSPGPAAWYPDPDDPRMLRYWDGTVWTRQIAPNPDPVPAHPYLAAVPPLPQPVAVAPPAAVTTTAVTASPVSAPTVSAPTPTPVSASVAVPVSASFAPSPILAAPFTPGEGTASISVPTDVAYVPMSRMATTSQPSRTLRHEGRSATLASWLYVFAPLLTVPFLWFGPSIDPDSSWSVARVALVGLAVIASVVLAGLDQRALQRLGVPNAPSALVGIIPVIFVIDRTARVGRSGVAVLLMSLLVQAAVAALLIRLLLPVLELTV